MTALRLFTVYNSPSDYPGRVVVRGCRVVRGDIVPDREPLAVVDSLDAAREAVPPGLVRFEREDADDRCIVEVWM